MMKYLLILLTIGCVDSSGNTRENALPTHSKFKCIRIETELSRCENSEVVCYIFSAYNKGGLSCKWKIKGGEE